MLLSHTAGFTHEAPVGNNNELDPGTFDAHVRSISDTWLRFPVGTGYAYSNLGIDLAGYILERVERKPFAEVMRDSLLEPLGMDHSTFDRAVIRATADRAVGHVHPYPQAAARRADDGGRRSLHERRGLGSLSSLRAERRLDRRPGRARLEVASGDARRSRRRTPARRPATRSAWSDTAGTAGSNDLTSSSTAVEASGSSPTCGGCPSSGSGSPS